jgi:ATP-dependent exoDNAse (exonuclease V) beta subunit
MNDRLFQNQMIRASAGSGKTHRLTNRYLALLAAGVEPDAILATTFTRKAAAEILDRVLERLARAASNADAAAELAKQIQTDDNTPHAFAALLRRLLRNLHRVRIGTLDSFYIALASSFSLELGLPPGWTICEEADDEALHGDALELLLDQQADDIRKLVPVLSKGDTTRSVQEDLLEVIRVHYEAFRGSEQPAWQRLHVPPALAPAARTEAIDKLRVINLAVCGDKRFATTRDSDLDKFESQNWSDFLGFGLAKKVREGESVFYKKPIPPDARALYELLVRHARSEILQRLKDQTTATWQLLDVFDRQLDGLKQSTGLLRFDDVTHALVNAVGTDVLRAEAMAFRLDAAVEHLLLDEFQDTSLTQWHVLEPIAQRITQGRATTHKSFFCVGDVKQAIYGWRGGMAEIFDALPNSLGRLQSDQLIESRRSAQPIIDVVNRVFGNLRAWQSADKCQDALDAWSRRFEQHTTARKDEPGYVCLHTGPALEDGQGVKEQRAQHCHFVAKRIHDLAQQMPHCSIGVLCRRNETVGRMIYELRQCGTVASEEGGNPLTDSPAVEVLLSLFTLTDHPGHSIAWFHLNNSPLKPHLAGFASADACARRQRGDLLSAGYGEFTHLWARRLARACDRRDLGRLQQLVEMAYDYQPRSTLRADAFVAWVREQRVPDPSDAKVRVMTMHAAKGLQFDVVVLPELDAKLTGKPPSFVVGHDDLRVNFVCRYADQGVQELLSPEDRTAFDMDRQQRAEESLSLLYVAMTRARNALYLFVPGPRDGRSNPRDAWYNLLLQSLAPDAAWNENALIYEHGDPAWFAKLPPVKATLAAAPPDVQSPITFRTDDTARRRGLEFVAPSGREGQAKVALGRMFDRSTSGGMAAGTLYHAWFATIGWLDDGMPTDASLRAAADAKRIEVPPEIWRELDSMLATFRKWLANAAINRVLQRSAYAGPEQPGFPAALAPVWSPSLVPRQVEQERRFLVHDGSKFWNGSLDRVVWLADGDRIVAADILDYKTDAVEPGEAALKATTDHYRPQLEAYRRAVPQFAAIPENRIATRLVFTHAGRVVDV